MTAELAPVRAKCLGCAEILERRSYEETASSELVRIQCATCGAKRIAKVVYGEAPVPNPPAPPPASPGPTKEEEIDLLAEARRIFDNPIEYPERDSSGYEANLEESERALDQATGRDPDSDLEKAYRAWLRTEAGGVIAKAIRDRAMALHHRGWTHYGIAALFEAARFDRSLDLGPEGTGEDYRLNNSYRSRLARDLMAKYPELEGFFETRELRS